MRSGIFDMASTGKLIDSVLSVVNKLLYLNPFTHRGRNYRTQEAEDISNNNNNNNGLFTINHPQRAN